MGKTTDLRNELRRVFFPFMKEKGFAAVKGGSPLFMEFRKTDAHRTYLLDIQWDKYQRPRFVINFAHCDNSGVTFAGKHIPAESVLIGQTPVMGRLYQGKRRSLTREGNWFRQDVPILKRLLVLSASYPATQVVEHLMKVIPEVEHYWGSGEVGKHMVVWRSETGSAL